MTEDLREELIDSCNAVLDGEGSCDAEDFAAAILPTVERAVAAERQRCIEAARNFLNPRGMYLTADKVEEAIRALPPSAGAPYDSATEQAEAARAIWDTPSAGDR